MPVSLLQHFDSHPKNPAAFHRSAPFCIIQVAAVCRRTCGVILSVPIVGRPAAFATAENPFSRRADVDLRSPGRRRGRMVQPPRRRMLQPLSAADHRARRFQQGRALDRSRLQDLSRRRPAYHQVVRPSPAASAGEGQPCDAVGRPPRHRQRHLARAGEARGRPLELSGSFAAATDGPVQRILQGGDPSRLRGLGPGRPFMPRQRSACAISWSPPVRSAIRRRRKCRSDA